MSDAADTDEAGPDDEAEEAPKAPARRKLVILAVPVVLVVVAVGLWFSGVLPRLLGLDKGAETAAVDTPPQTPTFVDVPELVANLNGGPRRQSYVKMTVRIEVPSAADADKVRTAMPRLQDVIQTYLREMRPEELRGSAGVYRLREELIVRAGTAVAPARITDVLFTQMLIQ
jgi:flagellar FliL protein